MKLLGLSGAATIAFGVSLMATNANALTINGTSGTWSNTVGGSSVQENLAGGDGFNQVRWGTPITSDGKSGLGFKGAGVTPAPIDTNFLLGELRHYNNVISGGTAASSSDLTVSLDIADVGLFDFDFTLTIDETVNSASPCPYGDTQPCGDSIFWDNAFAPQSFSSGGINYTLQLIGFGPGGTQTNFFSDENATNTTDLYARITEVPSEDVPTPAAVLPILGGLFGSAIRKKKREDAE